MKILLNDIKPDPNQPRKIFDEESLRHLADSLKVEGVIHPIEVDKDYMIIVGEMRYRAAKLLGWTEIEANIHQGELPPYERLRRQMAENLQQSGSKGGGKSMNPIDTAKAWARLYELKTGLKYTPGEHFSTGRGNLGPFETIAQEVGVDKITVWEELQLLNQSDYIIKDIESGRPRTYYREANLAPKELQEPIKQKIAQGEYSNREQIISDVQLIKTFPDFIPDVLARKQHKENVLTNRTLGFIAKLALALRSQPLNEVNPAEQNIVKTQLEWLQSKIAEYLEERL